MTLTPFSPTSAPWFALFSEDTNYFPSSFSPTTTGYYPAAPQNIDTSLSVRVTPSWYSSIYIEWFPATGSAYTSFNVFSSPTEAGPFQALLSAPTTQFSTVIPWDKRSGLKYNQEYFFVEGYTATGSSVSALTTWVNARSSPIIQALALDTTRREWILLRKFTGVASYLFKRKTYGKRCPSCWNQSFQKVMNDHCPICYGTSFEGGYYSPPVFSLVQYDALTKAQRLEYFGKFEPSQISGWTINYPTISPFDLIYRPSDGKMMRVDVIQTTSLQAQTVRQMFELVELDKGSIEYKLALTVPSPGGVSAQVDLQNPWLNPS